MEALDLRDDPRSDNDLAENVSKVVALLVEARGISRAEIAS